MQAKDEVSAAGVTAELQFYSPVASFLGLAVQTAQPAPTSPRAHLNH